MNMSNTDLLLPAGPAGTEAAPAPCNTNDDSN